MKLEITRNWSEFVFETVTAVTDVDGDGLMQQAVEQGGGADRVVKDIAPVRVGFVSLATTKGNKCTLSRASMAGVGKTPTR